MRTICKVMELEDNIKISDQRIGFEDERRIELAQDRA
jgi:hypothetical protein